jgi:hypothetical protein
MPKPSERIFEIFKDKYALNPERYEDAIVYYLDKQYEQNKPCEYEHKWKLYKPTYVDRLPVPTYICRLCGQTK